MEGSEIDSGSEGIGGEGMTEGVEAYVDAEDLTGELAEADAESFAGVTFVDALGVKRTVRESADDFQDVISEGKGPETLVLSANEDDSFAIEVEVGLGKTSDRIEMKWSDDGEVDS